MTQRTPTQNNAMHRYFELLAQALNDAGLDMRRTLKPEWEIPWTAEMVKEHIWRPVQKVMLDRQSTTQLQTIDVGEVYDVINRHMAEKHGVHVPFPSSEGEG